MKKKAVTLSLDLKEFDAPYMSTLWKNNQIVGEVTSGAWGYRVRKSVALAMVKTEFADSGEELELDVFGHRVTATVHDGPALWDPDNERMTA